MSLASSGLHGVSCLKFKVSNLFVVLVKICRIEGGRLSCPKREQYPVVL